MARVTVLPQSEALGIVDARELLGDRPGPETDAKTGAPSELRPFVVSQEPRIVVVPHFLTACECEHLQDLSGGQWTRSLVGQLPGSEGDEVDSYGDPGAGGGDMRTRQAQTRTSSSCMLRPAQTVVLERIEHRLAGLAKQPVENLERLVVVRYSPGEEFSEHHDGKFRPRTVFIYLNDLPEGDDGHTYFPHLGLSFVPRAGCAVMWSNATPEGIEDSRMVHAGRPPLKAVKYGVNCFFNEERMRLIEYPDTRVEAEDAFQVDVRAHHKNGKAVSSQDPARHILHTFTLQTTPEVKAVPRFASEEEVQHLLDLLDSSETGSRLAHDHPLKRGTATLRSIAPCETTLVAGLEVRLAALTRFPVEHLGWMRIVKGGSAYGLCNRGCGQRAALVCLCDSDEIFFPHLNLRLLLRRGDLISWPNAWQTQAISEKPGARVRVVEDLRSTRVHLLGDRDMEAPIALEACFHDTPVTHRLQAERLE